MTSGRIFSVRLRRNHGSRLDSVRADGSLPRPAALVNCVSTLEINLLLQKFWEDEEISLSSFLSEDEERCERYFLDTHSRSPLGRYIVRLPFKNDLPIKIGELLSIAASLLHRMENKLRNRSDLQA